MSGDQLTQEIIRLGITFVERTIPTRWHHRQGGDTPRTCLCYEDVTFAGSSQYNVAQVIFKGAIYSIIFTFERISDMTQIELKESDLLYNSLIISQATPERPTK